MIGKCLEVATAVFALHGSGIRAHTPVSVSLTHTYNTTIINGTHKAMSAKFKWHPKVPKGGY